MKDESGDNVSHYGTCAQLYHEFQISNVKFDMRQRQLRWPQLPAILSPVTATTAMDRLASPRYATPRGAL